MRNHSRNNLNRKKNHFTTSTSTFSVTLLIITQEEKFFHHERCGNVECRQSSFSLDATIMNKVRVTSWVKKYEHNYKAWKQTAIMHIVTYLWLRTTVVRLPPRQTCTLPISLDHAAGSRAMWPQWVDNIMK